MMYLAGLLALSACLGSAAATQGGNGEENESRRRDKPLTHSLQDIDHVILLMQGKYTVQLVAAQY